MKNIIKFIICIILISKLSLTYGQEFGDKDTLRISFISDVNFSKSSNDNRKESAAGIGTMGIKFERGYFYGSANFTIFSQNSDISPDSSEKKIFGTNLLLPENSSSKVSNFSVLLGLKTLYINQSSLEANTFSLKRIGTNIEFKVNNNVWQKDSLSTLVTINTFNFNLNYLILNAKILNTEERIRLLVSYGFTSRRLGGDFGLNSNKELRRYYLGTNKRGFNGSNIGFRLEVSKFYGEMNLTSFENNLNIAGFSGNQAIISMGLIADLTLVAKEMGIGKKK